MADTQEADAQAIPGAIPGSGAIPDGQHGQAPAAGGAIPPAGDGESERLAAALKAEREARRKAEQAVKDLQKTQADGLSESERLSQRVAELEQATKRAERAALVQRIAMETGLPSVLADRMHGDDEDSLRADAEALKAAIPAPQQPTQTTTSVGGPQGPPAAAKSPEEWLGVIRGKR